MKCNHLNNNKSAYILTINATKGVEEFICTECGETKSIENMISESLTGAKIIECSGCGWKGMKHELINKEYCPNCMFPN